MRNYNKPTAIRPIKAPAIEKKTLISCKRRIFIQKKKLTQTAHVKIPSDAWDTKFRGKTFQKPVQLSVKRKNTNLYRHWERPQIQQLQAVNTKQLLFICL
jgi:hypothetical protein